MLEHNHEALNLRLVSEKSTSMFLCVRWYLRYALSYRDLEEMMRGRGLSIDHTTIYRWVQAYAPELEMFAPELVSGEVAPVLEEWSLPPMDLWVTYPSGRLTSAKARSFVKWFEMIMGYAT